MNFRLKQQSMGKRLSFFFLFFFVVNDDCPSHHPRHRYCHSHRSTLTVFRYFAKRENRCSFIRRAIVLWHRLPEFNSIRFHSLLSFIPNWICNEITMSIQCISMSKVRRISVRVEFNDSIHSTRWQLTQSILIIAKLIHGKKKQNSLSPSFSLVISTSYPSDSPQRFYSTFSVISMLFH